MLNTHVDLVPNHYGRGTEAIRSILHAARGISWFPPRKPSDAAEQDLVGRHLESLGSFYPDLGLPNLRTEWIAGTLEDFDQLAPKVMTSEGWGDPWGSTPWGRLLFELHRDVQEQIERDTSTLDLVKPPVWPLTRNVRLVTEALYESPPPQEFRRENRWASMEHVQYNFWRALDWALLWPDRLDRSPFYHLYQLHLVGLYPLGFGDDRRFRLFYRADTAAA